MDFHFLLRKSCVWNESKYKNGQSVLLVLLRYQEDTYQLFGVNDKTCNHFNYWNLNLKLFTNSLKMFIKIVLKLIFSFLSLFLLFSVQSLYQFYHRHTWSTLTIRELFLWYLYMADLTSKIIKKAKLSSVP